MGSAFIKMEIVFRNVVPWRLLVTWGFPALYLVTMAKLLMDENQQPSVTQYY